MEAGEVFGRRLHAARKRAGLSQRALAGRVGLSAMAISKYEQGRMLPGSERLIALAEALGVPVEYLLRPDPVSVTAIAWRSHPRVPARARDAAVSLVADWVERYRELEQLLGEQLPGDAAAGVVPGHVGDPERAAQSLRAGWGLGEEPIPSLVDLLEEHGVRVGFLPLPAGVDAMSFRVEGGEPCVVVRPDVPGDRQRFSLAHELAHLAWPGERPAEAFHRFARAFLVPAEAARRELGRRRERLCLEELQLLKARWGFSIAGWLHRAEDLGLVGPREIARWRRLFREKGWNRHEPGPAVPPERPDRFTLLLLRAVSEGLINRRRASELAGMPYDEFVEFVRRSAFPGGPAGATVPA